MRKTLPLDDVLEAVAYLSRRQDVMSNPEYINIVYRAAQMIGQYDYEVTAGKNDKDLKPLSQKNQARLRTVLTRINPKHYDPDFTAQTEYNALTAPVDRNALSPEQFAERRFQRTMPYTPTPATMKAVQANAPVQAGKTTLRPADRKKMNAVERQMLTFFDRVRANKQANEPYKPWNSVGNVASNVWRGVNEFVDDAGVQTAGMLGMARSAPKEFAETMNTPGGLPGDIAAAAMANLPRNAAMMGGAATIGTGATRITNSIMSAIPAARPFAPVVAPIAGLGAAFAAPFLGEKKVAEWEKGINTALFGEQGAAALAETAARRAQDRPLADFLGNVATMPITGRINLPERMDQGRLLATMMRPMTRNVTKEARSALGGRIPLPPKRTVSYTPRPEQAEVASDIYMATRPQAELVKMVDAAFARGGETAAQALLQKAERGQKHMAAIFGGIGDVAGFGTDLATAPEGYGLAQGLAGLIFNDIRSPLQGFRRQPSVESMAPGSRYLDPTQGPPYLEGEASGIYSGEASPALRGQASPRRMPPQQMGLFGTPDPSQGTLDLFGTGRQQAQIPTPQGDAGAPNPGQLDLFAPPGQLDLFGSGTPVPGGPARSRRGELAGQSMPLAGGERSALPPVQGPPAPAAGPAPAVPTPAAPAANAWYGNGTSSVNRKEVLDALRSAGVPDEVVSLVRDVATRGKGGKPKRDLSEVDADVLMLLDAAAQERPDLAQHTGFSQFRDVVRNRLSPKVKPAEQDAPIPDDIAQLGREFDQAVEEAQRAATPPPAPAPAAKGVPTPANAAPAARPARAEIEPDRAASPEEAAAIRVLADKEEGKPQDKAKVDAARAVVAKIGDVVSVDGVDSRVVAAVLDDNSPKAAKKIKEKAKAANARASRKAIGEGQAEDAAEQRLSKEQERELEADMANDASNHPDARASVKDSVARTNAAKNTSKAVLEVSDLPNGAGVTRAVFSTESSDSRKREDRGRDTIRNAVSAFNDLLSKIGVKGVEGGALESLRGFLDVPRPGRLKAGTPDPIATARADAQAFGESLAESMGDGWKFSIEDIVSNGKKTGAFRAVLTHTTGDGRVASMEIGTASRTASTPSTSKVEYIYKRDANTDGKTATGVARNVIQEDANGLPVKKGKAVVPAGYTVRNGALVPETYIGAKAPEEGAVKVAFRNLFRRFSPRGRDGVFVINDGMAYGLRANGLIGDGVSLTDVKPGEYRIVRFREDSGGNWSDDMVVLDSSRNSAGETVLTLLPIYADGSIGGDVIYRVVGDGDIGVVTGRINGEEAGKAMDAAFIDALEAKEAAAAKKRLESVFGDGAVLDTSDKHPGMVVVKNSRGVVTKYAPLDWEERYSAMTATEEGRKELARVFKMSKADREEWENARTAFMYGPGADSYSLSTIGIAPGARLNGNVIMAIEAVSMPGEDATVKTGYHFRGRQDGSPEVEANPVHNVHTRDGVVSMRIGRPMFNVTLENGDVLRGVWLDSEGVPRQGVYGQAVEGFDTSRRAYQKRSRAVGTAYVPASTSGRFDDRPKSRIERISFLLQGRSTSTLPPATAQANAFLSSVFTFNPARAVPYFRQSVFKTPDFRKQSPGPNDPRLGLPYEVSEAVSRIRDGIGRTIEGWADMPEKQRNDAVAKVIYEDMKAAGLLHADGFYQETYALVALYSRLRDEGGKAVYPTRNRQASFGFGQDGKILLTEGADGRIVRPDAEDLRYRGALIRGDDNPATSPVPLMTTMEGGKRVAVPIRSSSGERLGKRAYDVLSSVFGNRGKPMAVSAELRRGARLAFEQMLLHKASGGPSRDRFGTINDLIGFMADASKSAKRGVDIRKDVGRAQNSRAFNALADLIDKHNLNSEYADWFRIPAKLAPEGIIHHDADLGWVVTDGVSGRTLPVELRAGDVITAYDVKNSTSKFAVVDAMYYGGVPALKVSRLTSNNTPQLTREGATYLSGRGGRARRLSAQDAAEYDRLTDEIENAWNDPRLTVSESKKKADSLMARRNMLGVSSRPYTEVLVFDNTVGDSPGFGMFVNADTTVKGYEDAFPDGVPFGAEIIPSSIQTNATSEADGLGKLRMSADEFIAQRADEIGREGRVVRGSEPGKLPTPQDTGETKKRIAEAIKSGELTKPSYRVSNVLVGKGEDAGKFKVMRGSDASVFNNRQDAEDYRAELLAGLNAHSVYDGVDHGSEISALLARDNAKAAKVSADREKTEPLFKGKDPSKIIPDVVTTESVDSAGRPVRIHEYNGNTYPTRREAVAARAEDVRLAMAADAAPKITSQAEARQAMIEKADAELRRAQAQKKVDDRNSEAYFKWRQQIKKKHGASTAEGLRSVYVELEKRFIDSDDGAEEARLLVEMEKVKSAIEKTEMMERMQDAIKNRTSLLRRALESGERPEIVAERTVLRHRAERDGVSTEASTMRLKGTCD